MSLRLDMVLVAVTAALALRLSVLAALLPFFSSRSVPMVWRLALAVVVAVAVAPAVRQALPTAPLDLSWTAVIAEGLRSALVGALLAFVISIPFEIVKYAGQIVDVQIGFAIVNTIDPQSGVQISVLANLYYLLSALLFFALDGHHVILQGLIGSCTLVPLFGPLDGGAASWLLVQEFGSFFRLGLQMAAPCVLVLLLVSMSMGFIVKTVPQINILVIGFPIQIAVGLAVLGLSMAYFQQVFAGLLRGMGGQLERLLAALQVG